MTCRRGKHWRQHTDVRERESERASVNNTVVARMTWIKKNQDLQAAVARKMLPAHTCEICGGARPSATSSGWGETRQQQALWPRCSVDVQVLLLCVSKCSGSGWNYNRGCQFLWRPGSCQPVRWWVCYKEGWMKCWYFERSREMVQRGLLMSGEFSGWLLSFLMFFFYHGILHQCVVPLSSKVLLIVPAAFLAAAHLYSTRSLSLRALYMTFTVLIKHNH